MQNNTSSAIAVALDDIQAENFLTDYEYFLRNAKPNSKRAILSTTKRLLSALEHAKSVFIATSQKKARSIKEWISKRRHLKSIKDQIETCKAELCSWINNTLSFFFQGVKWNVS